MPYYPQQYFNPYPQVPQYPVQQMQQPQQAPQPQQSGILWVSSEQEAANHLVMPNTAVALWNTNLPEVYLKQADASGRPTMRVYQLIERTQTSPEPVKPPVKYASMDDIKALSDRIDELAEIATKPTKEVKK